MCPLANLNNIMSTTPLNSYMSISGIILLSQRNNSAVASRDWQWNIRFEYLAYYYFLFFESIAMLLVTVVMQTFYNLRILSLLVFDIGILTSGFRWWTLWLWKWSMKAYVTKPHQSCCWTKASQALLETIYVQFRRSALKAKCKITS